MQSRRYLAVGVLAVAMVMPAAVAWGYAPAESQSLCRFVSSATGLHFYTANWSECGQVDTGTSSGEFRPESTDLTVFWSSARADYLVPLYRLYDTATGNHLYTTSEFERNQVMALRGWQDEGVDAMVYAQRPTIEQYPEGDFGEPQEVRRLYNTRNGDHLYTASPFEIATVLAQGGWVDEGVAYWALQYQRASLD